ncbi:MULTISPECIES: cytochrome c family protein [unclassified Hyphomicrobium]|uniref:c-type cytochrome n=1 Tax=unclassified Hyphomicrobium TaxID=2619925 RepID=UPI000213F1C0|nr:MULTISPECIES: cytochrome c family protein [unclassified Hyphomicrobium]CCB64863.1 Cytochrome c2 precursor [Hyphomicrobium sp. MC1]
MRKWVLAIAMIAVAPSAGMAADAAAGEKVFAKCKACHQVDKNGVGPHLGGLIGRKAGSVEGYNYSEALKKSGITWDEASLDKWLQGPSKDVPGTKMIFPGVKDATQRADLIAYLATLK